MSLSIPLHDTGRASLCALDLAQEAVTRIVVRLADSYLVAQRTAACQLQSRFSPPMHRTIDFWNVSVTKRFSMEGLEWIGQQAALIDRPSVVSMSILAFATSQASYDAVEQDVLSPSISFPYSSTNHLNDTNWSPARTSGAITVGATDITDARAWFSNYGSIVDVFAPGVDVTGPATQFPTAQTMMSGTSMATPHVAGLVAYLIAKDGNISPAAMSTKVKNLASVGYLHDLPAGTGNRIIWVPL
ncbi:peptidase S8/S53 domain-containing protein [Coprinopsis sp. MPI-PUGE-AT-0042]|nr:peptidase S8/S53 domain-containing protein [Coprinopsis sp. MPI-PUGE-AT-0042]